MSTKEKNRRDGRDKHNITVHRNKTEWKALVEAAGHRGTNIAALVDRYLLDYAANTTANRVSKKMFVAPVLQQATLTPEQVDPDFKGSVIEFTRLHGYITLHTKTEKELHAAARRGATLIAALREIELPPTVDPGDLQAWIQEGQTDGGKRDERLLRKIHEVRSLITGKLPTVLDEIETWLTDLRKVGPAAEAE
ncbi:hypothetical protein FJ934_04535 [Mesorhizobium sp. B2-4-12]|uniref:hypothetical protein n=1 Tax=Mesorhizobium sp. B2-4-12 TaxID=2589937 RepID=UPI00112C5817|nr:hypothetical protein [Mesorhizobium sp. B2-4-12]TPK98003.1 hypothetical protein FJ934_04535 [Mesorhizobium sp. B2-4-12]